MKIKRVAKVCDKPQEPIFYNDIINIELLQKCKVLARKVLSTQVTNQLS